MARKDSRGYALKKGESQRKDGRYVFRYTTIRGEQKAVYAKELSELRKKEVKIRRAIEDGLDPDRAERITLNELFDEYISQKYDLKQSTLTNYKYMYNHYVRVDFGKRRISKIKYTDVKKFYYSLIMEKGFKPNSMEIVNTLLHPPLCQVRPGPAAAHYLLHTGRGGHLCRFPGAGQAVRPGTGRGDVRHGG